MNDKVDLNTELEELREKIDEIDLKIIDLLNKRGDIALEISTIKNLLNLDISQPHR